MIDLPSKKRTMIDRPGYTDSYCWSSDGSKVAYTWQMPLHRPEEVAEREPRTGDSVIILSRWSTGPGRLARALRGGKGRG